MSDIEKDKVDTKLELHSVFSSENIETNQVLEHVISIDGRVVDVTGDVDEAMQYALDTETITLSLEQEKSLLRRIDLFLLPLICLLYAMQFMDKVSSGYAAVVCVRIIVCTVINILGVVVPFIWVT